jgi:hypothetical protein
MFAKKFVEMASTMASTNATMVMSQTMTAVHKLVKLSQAGLVVVGLLLQKMSVLRYVGMATIMEQAVMMVMLSALMDAQAVSSTSDGFAMPHRRTSHLTATSSHGLRSLITGLTSTTPSFILSSMRPP